MKTTPKAFRLLDRAGRVRCLVDEGLLASEQADVLMLDVPVLPHRIAEHMIENVIGVFGLPLGIAPGVVVNGKSYDVPMAIEEPSVVAAQGNSAKVVRLSGGYTAGSSDPIMIGQVQLVEVPDIDAAARRVQAESASLLAMANEAIPGIVRRGGGAQAVEVRKLHHPEDDNGMLVVHVLANVQEAMGANAINTIVEHLGPQLEELTGGRSVLKILSNLADRRVTWAECNIDVEHLAVGDMDGHEVALGVERASKLAEIDPYRAATHNKGAMNGIDAVIIATGNDFRAVEAGAHAYVCRDGRYGAMSIWRLRGDKLWGRIEIPLALGIVGGQVKTHPWVATLLKLLGIETAAELANVVAAVGLGQNLGALRAMASKGIQAGHMAMHARTIAMEVGAENDEVAAVAEALKQSGKIDRENAQKILVGLRNAAG